MKTKTNMLLLRIFSALLCFHFLNISVETHKYFLSPDTSTSVTPLTQTETTCLVEMLFNVDLDTQNSLPENNTSFPDNNDGEEEEEKKFTDDDFYSTYQSFIVLSDDQKIHSLPSVSNTKEFISEIIPPPPKA